MGLFRCFSSLGCPQFSLDEMIALAAKHQIDAIELRAFRGTVELPRQLKVEFGSAEALAHKFPAGAGVPVIALGTSLRLTGATAEARAAFLEFVPWAEALRVPRLRVFDGGTSGDPVELAAAAQTVEWWRGLRTSRGWQTDIMVETHDMLLTSATIQRFWERAPGTAILWDTHHTWCRGGEDPLTTWRAIRQGVCHVHVKDSVPIPSGRFPFTYVLPGRGDFPVAQLMEALRTDGFRGVVSLEWEKMWHPELPSLDQALTAAQKCSWW
jgi:sugar phosphate isomerase/epimerase